MLHLFFFKMIFHQIIWKLRNRNFFDFGLMLLLPRNNTLLLREFLSLLLIRKFFRGKLFYFFFLNFVLTWLIQIGLEVVCRNFLLEVVESNYVSLNSWIVSGHEVRSVSSVLQLTTVIHCSVALSRGQGVCGTSQIVAYCLGCKLLTTNETCISETHGWPDHKGVISLVKFIFYLWTALEKLLRVLGGVAFLLSERPWEISIFVSRLQMPL